jgi:hypothetical protein
MMNSGLAIEGGRWKVTGLFLEKMMIKNNRIFGFLFGVAI